MADRVVAVLGASGSGKTTYMRGLIEGRDRVILMDPTRDKGFADWGVHVETFAELVDKATRAERFRVVWSAPPQTALSLDAASHLARQLEDCTLAIDELHLYCTKQLIPPTFAYLCLVGRHEGVSIVGTTQRPALVHNNFLSQAQRWVVFRLMMEDDLDAVRKIVPAAAREKLPGFKPGEHIELPEKID